jgi:hypothetical protein
MSESRNHVELVAIAVKYIKTIVAPDLHAIIQYDSADSSRPTRVIGNFIPDVYFWHNDQLIIGEAKTINDFDRPHSLDQYEAYIKECKSFYGHSTLVISVPWQVVATAKNYFRRLKKEFATDIPIIIINELGRHFKI